MGDARRRAQDTQEQTVITRILAKFFVDQVQVAANQADRVSADAADIVVLLKQHEQGVPRKMVGLLLTGRGVLRAHQRVRCDAGEGEITSVESLLEEKRREAFRVSDELGGLRNAHGRHQDALETLKVWVEAGQPVLDKAI